MVCHGTLRGTVGRQSDTPAKKSVSTHRRACQRRDSRTGVDDIHTVSEGTVTIFNTHRKRESARVALPVRNRGSGKDVTRVVGASPD